MSASQPRSEPEPFERIVAEHGPTVLRVCRALLPDDAAADAWSETFIAALRASPRLRPHSNVVGWLVTIAHRRAIDELRRRSRTPTPAGAATRVAERPEACRHASATDGDPARLADELDDRLRTALEALSDRQRLAVVARHLGDLSYPDVAALLGGSEAAARRAVADGIAHLRRSLDQEAP